MIECKSKPVIKTQQFRVTGGGKSCFEYIVHFVTPTIGCLAQKLEQILILVNDNLKKKSIALPAIGTGKKTFGLNF